MSKQEKEKKSLLQITDIKVILPNNPPKQRKLGDNSLLTDLTKEVLEDICLRIFNIKKYIIENEQRSSGRYITLINQKSNEIHFVCLSNPNNDARNARLMQFIPTTFIQFSKCNCSKKYISAYLIKPNNNDENSYAKIVYRWISTIGIPILNAEKLKNLNTTNFLPIHSYEELKYFRNQTKGKNRSNNQTYFTDDGEQISIYGKTFGANSMESFIFGLILAKISTKPIIFYPVRDNESENISSKQQQILEQQGIEFGEVIYEFNNNNIDLSQPEEKLRNTPKFHFNLLQKFGEKRCYLCGCDMEHLIIGSHIERVTDITHNSEYSIDEKKAKIVDKDNGFWFCANHDKMFEYGQIFFTNATLTTTLTEKDKDFLTISIQKTQEIFFDKENRNYPFVIRNEHYNSKTQQYLHKHFQRVSNYNQSF